MLIFVSIVAAYGALMLGLTVALRPLRLQLADIAERLLSDSKVSSDSRDDINLLLDTCLSFKVSVLFLLALCESILGDLLRHPVEAHELEDDPRFHALVWRYFVSIAGINPIVLVFAIPIGILSLMVHSVTRKDPSRHAVEDPVLVAARAMAPQLKLMA